VRVQDKEPERIREIISDTVAMVEFGGKSTRCVPIGDIYLRPQIRRFDKVLVLYGSDVGIWKASLCAWTAMMVPSSRLRTMKSRVFPLSV
jgi:hypothetical protein